MDKVDRKILAELQRDGRLSITELANRVRLSISPCHRRLRALESSGAITGYRAQLDAHSLGLDFEALVFVTMRAADRVTIDAFEEAIVEIPNVLQAQRLFGDPDYLLRVVTRDPVGVPDPLRRTPRHPARRAAPDVHAGDEERRRRQTLAAVMNRGLCRATWARR